jgi:hypothetical protein
MREDRNFKASDVGGPSIWIFILCLRSRPSVLWFEVVVMETRSLFSFYVYGLKFEFSLLICKIINFPNIMRINCWERTQPNVVYISNNNHHVITLYSLTNLVSSKQYIMTNILYISNIMHASFCPRFCPYFD